MSNHNPTYPTRMSTRAGLHPSPPPLYSPQLASRRMAAEAEESHVDPSLDTSAQDPAGKHFPDSSGCNFPASSGCNSVAQAAPTTGVTAQTEASALSPLPQGNQSPDVHGEEPASDTDEEECWIPVTRRTRRSRSAASAHSASDINEPNSPKPAPDAVSNSTLDKATENMSRAELEESARRYQSMSNHFNELARSKSASAEESGDAQNEPSGHKTSPKEYQGMLIDFGEEQEVQYKELESVEPAGPSRKDKGADPRNWGGIPALKDFSKEDLEMQELMLNNFADNKHSKDRKKSASTVAGDFNPSTASTPKAHKASGKRSRAGNSVNVEVPKMLANNASVSFAVPAAPAAGDDAARSREAKPALDILSGLFTKEELVSLVNDKITELASQQLAKHDPSLAIPDTPPPDVWKRTTLRHTVGLCSTQYTYAPAPRPAGDVPLLFSQYEYNVGFWPEGYVTKVGNLVSYKEVESLVHDFGRHFAGLDNLPALIVFARP
ncbi:hypothetical protein FB45DRAFT_1129601 [Roridomyces roridus]|uniref:Uncharacterized protein n=1 Tax=Roridomyces roridus TaxID=1738132 RepID=A0AAD7B300_9AGAR|nr:hypothetical protein FB45DRAFT_1129601 [Roridomyces roridus]